jgi:hypothetical protein
MGGEARAAELGFAELVALDHRAHRAVQDQDAAREQVAQLAFGGRQGHGVALLRGRAIVEGWPPRRSLECAPSRSNRSSPLPPAMHLPPLRLSVLMWGLAAAFYLFGFFQRVTPASLAPDLMRDFALSAAGLGNLSAFYYYAYAAVQIPTGVLVDRFGPSRMFLGRGAVLAGAGSLIFAWADTALVAGFGRALIGAAHGVAWVSMLKLVTHWFAPSRFRHPVRAVAGGRHAGRGAGRAAAALAGRCLRLAQRHRGVGPAGAGAGRRDQARSCAMTRRNAASPAICPRPITTRRKALSPPICARSCAIRIRGCWRWSTPASAAPSSPSPDCGACRCCRRCTASAWRRRPW